MNVKAFSDGASGLRMRNGSKLFALGIRDVVMGSVRAQVEVLESLYSYD